MARRSRQNSVANSVLFASAALLLVAVWALAYYVVRGRTTPTDPAEDRQTTPKAPGVAQRVEHNTPTPAQAPVEKPIVLRSDELQQKYAINEVDADIKYKDKLLEVTGTIAAVYQENPLIGIGLGRLQDPMPSILCEMDREQIALLSKLRRGQSITLRGTGMGKIQGGYLGIGNCRIISGGK